MRLHPSLIAFLLLANQTPAQELGTGSPLERRIRLDDIEGRWWLLDREGNPFFAHGVTHLSNPAHGLDVNRIAAACKDLGFNSYGYGCPPALRQDMPYLEGRNLVPISTYRGDGSFGFIDIFDPAEQAQLANQIEEMCLKNRGNSQLIGYCWTDLAAWPLKNSMSQNWVDFIRELPAGTAGRQAYDAFLGTWKGSNDRARDLAFLRLIAREYFRVCGETTRKHDPHHLVFGDRFGFETIVPEVIEEMLPWVDAIAIQPPFRAGFPKEDFDRVHHLTGKPILICDFAIRFKDGDSVVRGQLEETPDAAGERYAEYLRAALETPYIVGMFWCNPIDSIPGFQKAGIKQGIFAKDLVPRPELNDALREANQHREAVTPDGRKTATPTSTDTFQVAIEEVQNGTFEVAPPLPEDGVVTAGTTLTLRAKPAEGFALDSLYAAVTGFSKWTIYLESMTSPWELKVDQDMRIGASFIEESALQGFREIHDVVYAQPGVKPLKYDVFSPDGAEGLPCIIIIHGGGWSANTEDIMRGLARELVRTGDYVIFSIDYRLIKNRDGDKEPNTMDDLIGDVFGAIAHIQEHATEYGADPARIAVTGDSAGGHLSASVANMAGMIGDRGFGEIESVFEYRPSYVPEGKSITQVRKEISAAVQAAVPSYGVFGGKMMQTHAEGLPEGAAAAISPIDTIPDPKERIVHQLLLRGTKDWIKHEDVQAYADALTAAGQPVEYVQIEGVGHAFLDWKPNSKTMATFEKFAVPTAAKMKAFFDSVFNP